jgi:DNA-binding CsgD family transcriptional regulator
VADPKFTRREIRLLKTITPFIAHALTEQRPEGPFVDGDDRGLVIVNENGAIQHASREGRTLLMLARYATNAPLATTRPGDGLPDEVVRLCRRVATFSEANPLPTPPVWRCKSDWGEFVFRVFRMEQLSALPSPRLLGVSIERREPLRLKLLRRIGELPLSMRETELCLALLDGDSRGAIAERLGISETTAITHCRNLYGKLDVHNRMELVEKLQAM